MAEVIHIVAAAAGMGAFLGLMVHLLAHFKKPPAS